MKKFPIIVLLIFAVAVANAARKRTTSLRVSLNKQTVYAVRLNTLNALAYHYFKSSPGSTIIFSQKAYTLLRPDSLNRALKLAKTDAERYRTLRLLGFYYLESDPEKSLDYWDQGIAVAKKNNKLMDEAYHLAFRGYILMELGKYPESFQCLQLALAESENNTNEVKTWNIEHYTTLFKNRLGVLAQVHHKIGLLMATTNNPEQAIVEYKQAKTLCEQSDAKQLLGLANLTLATVYISIHQYALALEYYKNAETIFQRIGFVHYMGSIYAGLGELYQKQHRDTLALPYFYKAVNASLKGNNLSGLMRDYQNLSNYYIRIKQPDSSITYAVNMVKVSRLLQEKDLGNVYAALYKSYELEHKTDSAYKYQGLTIAAQDSSYQATIKSLGDFQKLSFGAQLRTQQLEKEKAVIQTRIRTYGLLAGVAVFMLLAAIFYRNNRQKQKANGILNQQKEEVQNALSQLKATQSQLIHAEKMASLGELTAGIAHEIQNPLNFINNFSEVNQEMIDEMEEALKLGDIEDALSIAVDIKQNEEKINHHGKRADAIVKGMLQHSRNGSGQKELTNINTLADEYLRLSYHGLRAKDKSFNATLETDFDEQLPAVNINPQDVGRVILNLLTNAFYAVNEKNRLGKTDYVPIVTISTKKTKSQQGIPMVELVVADNGMGVPQKILDKIYQPFFTTKPTGQGTGLGLSMSYDIIKAHGGDIAINSTEGQGATFTVLLPLG